MNQRQDQESKQQSTNPEINDTSLDIKLVDLFQQFNQLNIQANNENAAKPQSTNNTVFDDFTKMPLNPDEMQAASKLFGEVVKIMESIEVKQQHLQKSLNSFATYFKSGGEDSSDKIIYKMTEQSIDWLKDPENDEKLEAAFGSIVNEIVDKDNLYQPMRKLNDSFPLWLEENWEKYSQEDLEKYNVQMEIIEKICYEYETNEGKDSQKIFEMLTQLQKCGNLPQDLLNNLTESGLGYNNPFAKL